MKTNNIKKPNVFIVGAPRCGTTSMYRYLKQHPEVYFSERKEPEFFATDLPFRHSIRRMEDYLALFSGAKDEKRIGEASTFYLFSKIAAKNIKKFSPQAKIIIMLRRPIDQMRSFHNMMLSIYWESSEDIVNFSKAIAAEAARKQGLLIPKGNTMPIECYYYREIAKYSVQVNRYIEVFGRENVHFIIYDDLKRDVAQVYRSTCDFLGIDKNIKIDFIQYNTIGQPKSQNVFRMLRYSPNIFRHGIGQSVFTFLWKLNMRYREFYRIDSALKSQLDREYLSELLELSDILGRDLIKEWS